MPAFIQTSTYLALLKRRRQWACQVKGRPGQLLTYVRLKTLCEGDAWLCILTSTCGFFGLWIEPGIAILLEICYKFDRILLFSLLGGALTRLSPKELQLTKLTTDDILLQRVQGMAQLMKIDLWRLHIDPKNSRNQAKSTNMSVSQ